MPLVDVKPDPSQDPNADVCAARVRKQLIKAQRSAKRALKQIQAVVQAGSGHGITTGNIRTSLGADDAEAQTILTKLVALANDHAKTGDDVLTNPLP